MKQVLNVSGWALALLMSMGCAKEIPHTYKTVGNAEEAATIQKRLVGQAKFNVSKVFVSRLEIDSHPATITSLVPVFFRGYEPRERGFSPQEGRSFSLLTFNAERSGLELFTRDYKGGETYHEVVPLASLEGGLTICFPFINESGSLTHANVAFRNLRVK